MRPEIALIIKLDATYSAASLLRQSRTPQTLMTLVVLYRAPHTVTGLTTGQLLCAPRGLIIPTAV